MKRRFLVFLDCLLDTRLGTLASLNQDYLKKVLNDNRGNYFKRVSDDFDWIEPGLTEKYRKAYAERKGVDILVNSFKTHFAVYLRQLAIALLVNANEDPQWDDMSVEVNYWPFDLDEEQRAIFQEVITILIGGEGELAFDPNIKMVSIPLQDLTIERIGSSWDAVYMYDFIQWTDLIKDSFDGREMKAVNTELHVPTLFREIPDRKSLRLKDGSHINPFHEAKRNMALWINVNFINPSMYSIPDPTGLSKKQKKKK